MEKFVNITLRRTGINILCYAGVLSKFKAANPKALFEIVMLYPKTVGLKDINPSVLSPSPKLHSEKKMGLSFDKFSEKFEKEIFSNPDAIQKMRELKHMAETKEIFLVCAETNQFLCHRSLLKTYIDNLEMYLQKWGVK